MDEATGCKRLLLDWAFNSKRDLASRAVYTHECYDALIFKKVKQLLGGRVRVMVSGSAPIEKEVMTYLRICCCCPIHEGYGLTEVSAAVTMTTADYPTIGHVGAPLKMVRLRLKSNPEMEFLVTDKPYPRGEVVIKSGGEFGGYFMREDMTAEAFEDDGWFRSGDVGMILPNEHSRSLTGRRTSLSSHKESTSRLRNLKYLWSISLCRAELRLW